jgi:hypothetical protein
MVHLFSRFDEFGFDEFTGQLDVLLARQIAGQG